MDYGSTSHSTCMGLVTEGVGAKARPTENSMHQTCCTTPPARDTRRNQQREYEMSGIYQSVVRGGVTLGFVRAECTCD